MLIPLQYLQQKLSPDQWLTWFFGKISENHISNISSNLVVEPTPLKNMSQNGFIFPNFRDEHEKNIWVATNQSWKNGGKHVFFETLTNRGFSTSRFYRGWHTEGFFVNGLDPGISDPSGPRLDNLPIPGTPFVSYFLGNWKPLKPSNYCLKNRAFLGFPGTWKTINTYTINVGKYTNPMDSMGCFLSTLDMWTERSLLSISTEPRKIDEHGSLVIWRSSI